MRRFIFAITIALALLIPQAAHASDPIIGEIIMYGGYPEGTIPDGWVWCNGQALSRTAYNDLFDLIGIYFGSGDGSTTFNVPDIRGRMPIGWSFSGNTFDIGQTGGEYEHTLTVNEMPNHDHYLTNSVVRNHSGQGIYGTNVGSSGSLAFTYNQDTPNSLTKSVGGGQPHNNTPPYLTLSFIMYTGVHSSTPTPTPTPTETPTPTITHTPTATATPTTTPTPAPGQLSYIDAYTHTLESDNELLVPVSITFGQIITNGVLIVFMAVLGLDFTFRMVYRK